jgi:hypothetical protein
LSDTLGSAVRIEGWTEAGLPRDSFSIDNAVMVYHQKKWPLLIDPQGQVCEQQFELIFLVYCDTFSQQICNCFYF